MANPCKYTLKDGTVLDFTQARQYVMDNIAELTKESPTLKAKYDAATKGKVKESNQPEYKEGDTSREAPKASSSNRPVTSSITEEKTEKEKLADQLAASLESSLASQIAAEVQGMQPQQEQTYSEKAKRYSDRLRSFAANRKIKFLDENGD
jgi:fumarylacetoacetate (FAA) hydrolase family protein